MTIHVKGNDARQQSLAVADECGNLTVTYDGFYEAAALAQNQCAAVSKVPKNAEIIGLSWAHDALGANTGLTWGYESEDGASADADAFKTVADTSAAGSGYASVMPFVTTKDLFLTVTQTGSGTATGTVVAKAHYIFRGGE